MPFTESERDAWHREKVRRESGSPSWSSSEANYECICCGNPFKLSEGTITEEITICGFCVGDD